MQIEVIYCPACRNKLRIAEDWLGTQVQCPQCQAMFLAPPPPPGTAPPREEPVSEEPEREPVRRDERSTDVWVLIAGLALIGVSLLGILASALRFVIAFNPKIMASIPQNMMLGPMPDPQTLRRMNSIMGALFGLLSLAGAVGGGAMLMRRFHAVAVLGSVAMMLNIGDCCCLLGAPVGIACLYLLFQPHVRASFR